MPSPARPPIVGALIVLTAASLFGTLAGGRLVAAPAVESDMPGAT
jgi:hypothetical protein